MEVSAWYLDWKFWSAVVAWLSFTMNVAPWFIRKAKGTTLRISPLHSISLSHKIGITNLQWHLKFENDGGSTLNVERVYLDISSDKGQIRIPAFSYFEKNPADQTVFAGLRLKPGEIWQGFLWFNEDLAREQYRELRLIEAETRAELNRGRAQFPDRPVQVIGPQLLARINQFFESTFKLTATEYQVSVTAECKERVFSYPGYRFTLYEGDISELRSHTIRYLSGDGVSWYSDTSTWMSVTARKN
ncbi:hypothetical protein [Pseudomonas sp. LFM046]|uniref:hypothetical protein n=1 Tax=Pseudomonas sp. LFM046 TaxID=1608357 RepID=UPI0005CFC8DF|nr:hypothetical protein [Pseudomonas sp. LFM046]